MVTKLMGLSDEICYRKRKENVMADVLSRREREEVIECATITTIVPE